MNCLDSRIMARASQSLFHGTFSIAFFKSTNKRCICCWNYVFFPIVCLRRKGDPPPIPALKSTYSSAFRSLYSFLIFLWVSCLIFDDSIYQALVCYSPVIIICFSLLFLFWCRVVIYAILHPLGTFVDACLKQLTCSISSFKSVTK